MVDGHLQVQGEGVADLFEEDGEKLLVEVIKEELEVRATVPTSTEPLLRYGIPCKVLCVVSFGPKVYNKKHKSTK